MPRKARVEGAKAAKPEKPEKIEPTPDEAEIGVIEEAPAKPADPVPGDNGEAFARIVDYFKANHAEQWENIRLCPLQSGVEVMADILKAA
jgi:hypothetical protein